MELIDKVKIALRLDKTVFDSEVEMLIEGAKLDLEESGVDVDLNDELVQTAIVFFVKAYFGYDNKDSDRQVRAYHSVRNKLKLGTRWDKP